MNYVVCIWIQNKARPWQQHNTLRDGSDCRWISEGTKSVNERIGFELSVHDEASPVALKKPLKQTLWLLLHLHIKLPVLLPKLKVLYCLIFLPWQTEVSPTPQLFFNMLCEDQARSLLTGVTTEPLHWQSRVSGPGSTSNSTDELEVSLSEMRHLELSYFCQCTRWLTIKQQLNLKQS